MMTGPTTDGRVLVSDEEIRAARLQVWALETAGLPVDPLVAELAEVEIPGREEDLLDRSRRERLGG